MAGVSDATPGAKIYYTTDHSVPTTSSMLYTGGSIAINTDTQLKAIAVAPDYSNSPVAVADFYVSAAQPIISPPTGTYTSAQSVTIADTTSGPSSTTPPRPDAGLVFSGFRSNEPHLGDFIGNDQGAGRGSKYTTSPEGVASYNIIPPYAATPTFNLPPGFYHTAQMVGIFDLTPGAKIYYTTDHSVPTTSSTLYTGGSIPIDITTQ